MHDPSLVDLLAEYRRRLAALRQSWQHTCDLPRTPFFLFGMGARRKLLYREGELVDALNGEVLRRWEVQAEWIVPPAYTVLIETRAGGRVEIREDERGVWLVEDGLWVQLSPELPIRLPDFIGNPNALVLRVLHQEILVNIRAGLPVPNFFVYPRPWYRDAAMMAMVLRETGNLDLIRDWVLALDDPYDHNNGNDEPDNLGQVLYLLSLFDAHEHPLVGRVLSEIGRFRLGDYLDGITDGGQHPVYQTQWIKFGLGSLGLPDPYRLPALPDSYAELCWWGLPLSFAAREREPASPDYPYLTWAADITHRGYLGPLSSRDYPLTWEANASQAAYAGLELISPEYAARRLAAPHTWHAAEMFFRLFRQIS